MRKKIFRGKSLSTGNWIEGSLVVGINAHNGQKLVYIYPSDTPIYYKGSIDSCVGHKVDPNTVVQYVNREDLNGEKIFEGDVVNVYDRRGKEYGMKSVSVVIDSSTLISDGGGRWFPQDTVDVEVIGNVYDNFDLLSDKKKKWVEGYWFGWEV